MCLQGCATACSLKQTFVQYDEVFLEGTLAATFLLCVNHCNAINLLENAKANTDQCKTVKLQMVASDNFS